MKNSVLDRLKSYLMNIFWLQQSLLPKSQQGAELTNAYIGQFCPPLIHPLVSFNYSVTFLLKPVNIVQNHYQFPRTALIK